MSHTDAAREDARRPSGQFGEQHHTDPEVTLAPHREPALGALIEFNERGFTRRGIDNGDGTASMYTTRNGRSAVNIVDIPEDATVAAPAGSDKAASLARDLRQFAGSQSVMGALNAAISGE